MKQLIDRIAAQLEKLQRQYLEAAAYEIDLSLNEGADEADFAELEKELGYALPEDFKELYRIADGEAGQEVVLAAKNGCQSNASSKNTGFGKGCAKAVCSRRRTARRSAAHRKMQASNRIFVGIRNGFR
jgi:glucan synthase 1-related protein